MDEFNSSMITRDETNAPQTILYGIGVLLVVVGALMLVYIGFVVVDVIRSPGEVSLVALILERIEGEGRALFGHFGEAGFEIVIEEPLRTLIFLVLAVWVLAALASIIKTIVSAGRDLMSAADKLGK